MNRKRIVIILIVIMLSIMACSPDDWIDIYLAWLFNWGGDYVSPVELEQTRQSYDATNDAFFNNLTFPTWTPEP